MSVNRSDALVNLINLSIENLNGDHVYNNNKALYGYLPANQYLFIPSNMPNNWLEPGPNSCAEMGKSEYINLELNRKMTEGSSFAIRDFLALNDNDSLTLNSLKILIINFVKLSSAIPDNQTRFLVSALRARWITTGCLFRTNVNRGTPFDEITTIDEDDAECGEIVSAQTIDALISTTEYANVKDTLELASANIELGSTFVTKHSETIWCIVELLFRTRGHHYKREYEDLIVKVFSAANEGTSDLPNMFPYEEVFRIAIHPFGVKALPIMTRLFILHGTVGTSLIIRFNGSPNGFAAITTTYAGILTLQSEAWYSSFKKAYNEQIELITEFAKTINDNKYSYHNSAALYGVVKINECTVNGKTYSKSDMESIASAIAPILTGYCEVVADNVRTTDKVQFAFGNQKALIKRASNNPLTSLKMKTMLQAMLEKMNDAKTNEELINNVFPTLNENASNVNVLSNT